MQFCCQSLEFDLIGYEIEKIYVLAILHRRICQVVPLYFEVILEREFDEMFKINRPKIVLQMVKQITRKLTKESFIKTIVLYLSQAL
ncbi:LOW QUALITY PROTEIN: hypothetical protein KUTeg_007827 [Tegillarca granosa]|uniref:Uncharacterized protein n=1 Tax=Tegillarca granosa TaxID=220873 RepID=A0ABQ9FGL4_TEGGR|nr:LOW QUALITY PROTEIN: hypothetical protein KUTeg_007827 [Tegillarca granosa]